MSSDTVQEWGVEDVCKWLGGLNLETLEPAFKSNAVDGKDLLELSEGDMKDYLGCTPLQIRKINKGLAELGALTKAGAAAAAAAPAASAPAEPAAPAPSKPVVASKGTPTIDASDLSRYKELTQKIDALEAEQVKAKLSEATRACQGAQAALQRAQKELPPLLDAAAEAAKEVEKYSGDKFYLGKFLSGKESREKKLAEHQAALDQAKAAAAACEGRIDKVKSDLGAWQQQAELWRAKDATLVRLRTDRVALLDRIFNAPAWEADGTLASLKAAAADLERQAGEARGHASTYNKALGLLKQAGAKLQDAMQALKRTQFMGFMQMGRGFGPGPGRGRGSMMGNMMEMAMLRRANDATASAAQDVMAARQILPTLPCIDEADLRAARAGIFMNVLAPGVMFDMMQIAMVRKSIETVERMISQVQQSAGWTQREAGAFEGRAATLGADLSAKAAERDARRSALLRAALDKA